ncbi:hypothetical protein IFM89_021507 [Coptis chinensis]|uniref:peptidylprolyl isomerase n=1 Tax=Coptis chinensis TaxID=261450 RepID=A0A835HGK0_9MAGN|nr:hypothetical protein IFM89_021507 [Coptis chinensis]
MAVGGELSKVEISTTLSVRVKLMCSRNYVSADDELFEFKMDEEQVIDGLDRAVMTMKKGEVVESTIALEYGFGSSEFKQELVICYPNSTMKLSLNPLSRKENCGTRTHPRKLKAAGNFIEYDTNFSEEETKQSKVLKSVRVRMLGHSIDMPKLTFTWLIWTFFGIDIKVLEIDPNTKESSQRQQISSVDGTHS